MAPVRTCCTWRPTPIGNSYNIYDPTSRAPLGGFAPPNFQPAAGGLRAHRAIQNATASETGKLCLQYPARRCG